MSERFKRDRLQSRKISPARIAAFDVLKRVEEDAAYLSILLSNLSSDMRPEDRALCYEIAFGSVRWQLWLDRVIHHISGHSPESLDTCVRIALRMALYQIRFLSKIPHSAAVSESVNLTYGHGFQSASGFVNAILRQACRDIGYDPTIEITDPAEKLAVVYSHPEWLVRRWTKKFGVIVTGEIARENNRNAPLSFRICRDFSAVDNSAREAQILDELNRTGVGVARSSVVADAWSLRSFKRLKNVTGGAALNNLAKQGLVYIQDEASQLVASFIVSSGGDRIIDICAAPGSKTTQIAGSVAQGSLIVAGDCHQARLRTMKRSITLQKMEWIQPICYDAEVELPFAQSSFDKVLVDARCSGTGTLRRNPEIRWRISMSDIKELSAHQKKVISNAAKVVAPGGQLLYSTCSAEREENEEVVEDFLLRHPDFEPFVSPTQLNQIEKLPHAMKDEFMQRAMINIWPYLPEMDGFFIASLKRKAL